MSFNSLPFLFIFFPIFLVTYYLVPRAFQNAVLVIGSLIFYYVGVASYPWMVLLLAGEIVFTWLIGIALSGEKQRTWLLAISEIVLFACLFLFKYDTLLIHRDLAFPLAISFYTFQMAAYLFDVHRGKVRPERNIITYSAGVLMFMKLLSGPIASWDSIFNQLRRRTYSWTSINEGLKDFIVGLSLKVLLADSIGGIWSQISNMGISAISTPMAWLGIIAYSLQLYFDFYGDRSRPHARFPAAGQLPPSLCIQDDERVLAPLAYHAGRMVPRLHLHSAGRQPLQHRTHDL